MQVRDQYRNVEGYVVEVFEEIPTQLVLTKKKKSFLWDGIWKFRVGRTKYMTKTIGLGVSLKQIESAWISERHFPVPKA